MKNHDDLIKKSSNNCDNNISENKQSSCKQFCSSPSSSSSSTASTLSMISSSSSSTNSGKFNEIHQKNFEKIAYFNQLTVMSLQPSTSNNDDDVSIKNNENVNVDCQQQQQQQQQQIETSSSITTTTNQLNSSFCLLPENHFSDINVKVEYIDYPITTKTTKNSIESNSINLTYLNVNNNNNNSENNDQNIHRMNLDYQPEKQFLDKQRSNSLNTVCDFQQKQQQKQQQLEMNKTTLNEFKNMNKSSTKSLNLTMNNYYHHYHHQQNKQRRRRRRRRKIQKCKFFYIKKISIFTKRVNL